MFSPNPRTDLFNVIIPDTFFLSSITNKYNDYLKQKPYILPTIDQILIESIQSIDFPEFGYTPLEQNTIDGNNAGYNIPQPSKDSVQKLTEKIINITFRHTDGFMTYFMMMEHFFKRYEMGPGSIELRKPFGDIICETQIAAGPDLCRIYFKKCVLINSPDLHLSYASPTRDFSTFECRFAYAEFKTTFEMPTLNLKPVAITT